MKISATYKKMIIDEVKFAVQRMNKSQEASQKLYYFSAIFGIFHRVYNMEYDDQLVFAHFVLRTTHDTFQQRVNAFKQGGDMTVLISDKQFSLLSKLSNELAQKIKKNEEVDSTLKKFVLLSYSTTGNGYYLMEKGWLKI